METTTDNEMTARGCAVLTQYRVSAAIVEVDEHVRPARRRQDLVGVWHLGRRRASSLSHERRVRDELHAALLDEPPCACRQFAAAGSCPRVARQAPTVSTRSTISG